MPGRRSLPAELSSFLGRRGEIADVERMLSVARLVTLTGPAGVGKSRLTAEFLGSVDDAAIVIGRCLPYGEGITYWPVVEVVKQDDGEPGANFSGIATARRGEVAVRFNSLN